MFSIWVVHSVDVPCKLEGVPEQSPNSELNATSKDDYTKSLIMSTPSKYPRKVK